MQKFKIRLQLAALLLSGSLLLLAAPVSAEQGADDTTGSSDTTITQPTEGSSSNTSGGSLQNRRGRDATQARAAEDSAHPQAAEDQNDDNPSSLSALHSKGAQTLAALREKHKSHSVAARQKACIARQASINKRLSNFAAAAQRHFDTFNSIFTKVQAFQASKQLPVADYDSLVTTATDKQTAASDAVTALKSVTVQIDCTSNDPAASLATVKSAVSSAKSALSDYRTAIKNVIKALNAADTTSDTPSTEAQ